MPEAKVYWRQGRQAMKEDQARDAQRAVELERKRREGGVSWFKQPIKHESLVTLLDDALIWADFHSVQTGPKRWEQKVCLVEAQQMCPYCSEGVPVSSVYIAGSIINHTGFTNDKGETIRNFKQLLALKGEGKSEFITQAELIRQKIAEKNGIPIDSTSIAFTVWSIRRGQDPKGVATGVHFTYKGMLTRELIQQKLEEKGVEKEDWDAFLAPADYARLLTAEDEATARTAAGVSPTATNRVGSLADVADQGLDLDADNTLDTETVEDALKGL